MGILANHLQQLKGGRIIGRRGKRRRRRRRRGRRGRRGGRRRITRRRTRRRRRRSTRTRRGRRTRRRRRRRRRRIYNNFKECRHVILNVGVLQNLAKRKSQIKSVNYGHVSIRHAMYIYFNR